MFVVTEDDINDNAKNRYEWFGIIIPDDMLQIYIEKYFDRLTNNFTMVQNIHLNRAIRHVKGRTALRTHMKQLSKVKIASLIQNAVHIFFNTMFVMTEEDIKENAQKKYECFAIVIPHDQIEQYIRRWFDYLIKSKHTSDTSFLLDGFVMTQNDIKYDDYNHFYWFGIVIPDDLLSLYIQRLFDDLIKTDNPCYVLHNCRTLTNVAFQSATRTYIRKINNSKIASIMENATGNFINEMFIFKDNDSIDKFENRYECWYIEIPDDLLQQYIEKTLRCFDQKLLCKRLHR
ncbi:unnamed protein product [Mytilus edulis]|uniref:Uncharacterized protein n=1 Tax=Mytilus edulis TaxID=6550 RepID=A0A8S3SY08_MYTED|nr:unnamed protein product [Mytilus edulis]